MLQQSKIIIRAFALSCILQTSLSAEIESKQALTERVETQLSELHEILETKQTRSITPAILQALESLVHIGCKILGYINSQEDNHGEGKKEKLEETE